MVSLDRGKSEQHRTVNGFVKNVINGVDKSISMGQRSIHFFLSRCKSVAVASLPFL